MAFREPPFTIGVEEEYLLVDPVTRDVASDPPAAIMAECQRRLEGQASPDRLDAAVWAISYMIPDRELKITTGLDLSGGAELSRRSHYRGG